MTVEVRLATPDDYDQFMTLAAAYLVELRELGSEVRPTTKSLGFWGDLFKIYVSPECDEYGDALTHAVGVVVMLGGGVGFSRQLHRIANRRLGYGLRPHRLRSRYLRQPAVSPSGTLQVAPRSYA